jgi:aryl-alcohol dehydrogenase-like predicted oxidoreductase
MQKRTVGEKLRITPFSLGTWGIGGPPFWAERDGKESIKTIQKALDLGINCIDTAPAYGFGLAEEIVAKALAGRRDSVVIATKCGMRWKDKTNAGALYRDLAPASIRQELEDSLRRLHTDRIDLYQIHWPDPNTSIGTTMETLGALQREGKILEIGVSNYTLEMLKEARAIAPIASVQPKYNLLEREIEQGLLPYCAENGIAVLAYSPLVSGVLSGKYTRDTVFSDWRDGKDFGVFRQETWEECINKTERLKTVAEDYGMSLSQLAIRWLVEQKGVTSALVGCNTPEQVEENILALEVRIDGEFMELIENVAIAT